MACGIQRALIAVSETQIRVVLGGLQRLQVRDNRVEYLTVGYFGAERLDETLLILWDLTHTLHEQSPVQVHEVSLGYMVARHRGQIAL